MSFLLTKHQLGNSKINLKLYYKGMWVKSGLLMLPVPIGW